MDIKFADTPIVILDGSLTVHSEVPWGQFTGPGDQKTHPHANSSVRSVVVTVNGVERPAIAFQKQQCTVDVTYAGTDVNVATDANGSNLTFSPFGQFQGAGANDIQHPNRALKISHITVTRAGVKLVDEDPHSTGNTKVAVHYQ